MYQTVDAEDERQAGIQRTGGAENRDLRSVLWAAEARGGNAAPYHPT
mgnify:CR=1